MSWADWFWLVWSILGIGVEVFNAFVYPKGTLTERLLTLEGHVLPNKLVVPFRMLLGAGLAWIVWHFKAKGIT